MYAVPWPWPPTKPAAWGVAAETRGIESPCVSALSSLAGELDTRLIVLATCGGWGGDEAVRTQRILDIAYAAP